MQQFYTELYHLLYTQVDQFPLFTKAGYRQNGMLQYHLA